MSACLDCGGAECICRLKAERDALRVALQHMCRTHTIHGPCTGNDCPRCCDAYKEARAALAKASQP